MRPKRSTPSMSAPRWPDVFVVGAPKCGTTTLHAALRAHPEVYVPRRKEPHFFGGDLDGRWFERDPDAYRALFSPAAAAGARRAVDVSVFYLCSTTAAAEIAAQAPGARIVVALRDPVAAVRALHAQLHHDGTEPEPDLARALADPAGRRLDRGSRPLGDAYPAAVHGYRDMVRWAPQIARYVDRFGRDGVHVLRLEDLVADPAGTFEALCRFLDVAPPPPAVARRALRARNVARAPRSRRLHRWLHDPPPAWRRATVAALPTGARRAVLASLKALNTRTGRRPPDPGLEALLRSELAPDVRDLEALLGLDLAAWREGDRGR